MAGAAFYSRLAQTLPSVAPSLDLEHLDLIEPLVLRAQVVHGVALSIQVCGSHLHFSPRAQFRRITDHMVNMLPLLRSGLLGRWFYYYRRGLTLTTITTFADLDFHEKPVIGLRRAFFST